ncbi:MAG: cytochrome C biogenesis protein [Candidatus Moranbacteria bacterium]|nr:cytochrome C biogenesis protein [Candidatus Moranbacteria bacterium]
MTFFFLSILAGMLTVLSPCILPLLPIIVGGSLGDGRKRRWKPFVVTASLGVSVVLFTLLLKVSTVFITISPFVWQALSGGILLFFGLFLVFPRLWNFFLGRFGAVSSQKANQYVVVGVRKNSFVGDVVIGAALGPVFSTCSPTYFVILATVLPESFVVGLLYLFGFAGGLVFILLLIALVGQRAVGRLSFASDSQGWFRRCLGVLFLVVGVAVLSGYDKKFEAYLLDHGFLNFTRFEQGLVDRVR